MDAYVEYNQTLLINIALLRLLLQPDLSFTVYQALTARLGDIAKNWNDSRVYDWHCPEWNATVFQSTAVWEGENGNAEG